MEEYTGRGHSLVTNVFIYLNLVNATTLEWEFSTNMLLFCLSVAWLIYRLHQHLSIPLNLLVDKYHSISIPHNPTKISLDYIDDSSVLIRWENQSYERDNADNGTMNDDTTTDNNNNNNNNSSSSTVTNGKKREKEKEKEQTRLGKRKVSNSVDMDQQANITGHGASTNSFKTLSQQTKKKKKNGNSISHYFLYINNTLIGEFFNNPTNNNLYTSCSIKNLKLDHFYKIDLVSVNQNGFRNQPLSVIVNLNNLKNESFNTPDERDNATTTTTTTTTTTSNNNTNNTTIVLNHAQEQASNSVLHWKPPYENESGTINGLAKTLSTATQNTQNTENGQVNTNTNTTPLPPAASSYSKLTTMHSLETFSLEQLKDVLIGAQEELHSVIKYREEIYDQYINNETNISANIIKYKQQYAMQQELKKQQKSETSQLENQKNNIDFKKNKLTSKLNKLRNQLENIIETNEKNQLKLNELENTKNYDDLIIEKINLGNLVTKKQNDLNFLQKNFDELSNEINDLKIKLNKSSNNESVNFTKKNQKNKKDQKIQRDNNNIDSLNENEDMPNDEIEQHEMNGNNNILDELDIVEFEKKNLSQSNGIIKEEAVWETLKNSLLPEHYNALVERNTANEKYASDLYSKITSLNEKINHMNSKLQKFTEYGVTLTKKLITLQQQQNQRIQDSMHLNSNTLGMGTGTAATTTTTTSPPTGFAAMSNKHVSPPSSMNTINPVHTAGHSRVLSGGAGSLVLHNPNTYEDNTNGLSQGADTKSYISYLMSNYQQQQQQANLSSTNILEYTPLSNSSASLLKDKSSLYGSKTSNLWAQPPAPVSNQQSQSLNMKSSLSSLSSMYSAGIQQQQQQQHQAQHHPSLLPSSAPSASLGHSLNGASSGSTHLDSHQHQPQSSMSSSLSFYPMQASLSNSYSQASLQPTTAPISVNGQSSVWNDQPNINQSPPPSGHESLSNDILESGVSNAALKFPRYDISAWNIPNR